MFELSVKANSGLETVQAVHQSFNRENWFCFFVRTLQPVFANYVHRLSLHSYDTNTPRLRIHTQTTSIEGLSRGRCFLALALYIKIDFNLETVLILTLVVLHIDVGDTSGFNYSVHLNVFTFFPPDWGMLRRSRRVLIFL